MAAAALGTPERTFILGGAVALAAPFARPCSAVIVLAGRRPLSLVEQRELPAEALEHNFGGVFLNALRVGPFPRLQLTLEIYLRACLLYTSPSPRD